VVEFDSALHVGQSADVFTPGTVWLSWPTLPNHDWENVEFFGQAQYRHPLMLRAILSACAMTVATTFTLPSSPGGSDGTATATVTGGQPPFSFAWSNGATTATAGGLSIGTYTVTVTDGSGCTSVVHTDVMVAAAQPMPEWEFSISPNPSDGLLRVGVRVGSLSDIHIAVYDLAGRMVAEAQALQSAELLQELSLAHLPSGLYLVQADVDGQRKAIRVVVGR
jgi:hypothetical protein